jgi:hypothetical protein
MARAMSSKQWIGWTGALALTALALDSRTEVSAIQTVDEGCAQTSAPTEHAGATLSGFAGAGSGGVVYDAVQHDLKLSKEGGVFKAVTVGISDSHNVSCSADFDEDGWTDMVVGQSGNNFIYYYRNRTFENPEPDWTDQAAIRTPKFVLTTTIVASAATGTQHAGMVCGDFNGDGHQDFVYYKSGSDTVAPTIQRLYKGKGNGTFHAAYAPMVTPSQLPLFAQTSTNALAHDYNGDGWLDILYGGKKTTSNTTGCVVALLNNCPTAHNPGVACAVDPQFTVHDVITGQNFGSKGINALTAADFTGDGRLDLLAGSPSQCSNFSLWAGLPGGGFSATAQSIPSVGGASALISADFSLDGKPDMAWGRDGFNCTSLGGKAYYYKNSGAAEPFAAGFTTQLSEYGVAVAGTGVALTDYDLGTVLDYDHDPDRTIDAIIADGNNSGQYLLFANRVVSQYVTCADVASGALDLGDRADDEMIVTAARLSPTMVLPPGTSVTFYMSNEEPASWQLASPCVDDTSDYCVTFPSRSGRSIRWKATMCSNADRSKTPSIAAVEIDYDYTPAEEHFRGGVVVDDGVAYVGAFRQPGDRGHFYALNAGLSTTYWDAGEKLDAMTDASRAMYTATSDGADRLDFSAANATSAALRAVLGVASQSQAAALIQWQRSARFGIAGGGHSLTRLGSIETSTPAVLAPPARPPWYSSLGSQARQEVDVFVKANEDRPILVLFGSKDGALHAVRNDPSDIHHGDNGTEAWAFIPPRVAAGLAADKASGAATSYVDGSPALADVKLADGRLHTVAIVPGGNGSSAVFALDVTDTVSASGVSGPDPLWEILPGDALAGQGRVKPAFARVKIGGSERFIAILATGLARDNPSPPYTKGRHVMAVDVATGARMWRFNTACPVTADPVLFETDDTGEPGAPSLDGYIDRLVLADACGYVYKLDPAVHLTGSGSADGWLDSGPLGAIATGQTDPAGRAVEALFSTRLTAGAIGGDRPIAGTIGTRSDQSGRVVLFFGTGGLESYDPSQQNEFYAVYADTGAIRNKITGACSGGRCEKFYGGVAVSAEQVLFTRAIDPPVGTSTCELGAAEVTGVDLDDLNVQLAVATSSASVSALFGHAGAVYLTTLGGTLVRVGTPVASEAGGESGTGGGGGEEDGGDGPVSDALAIVGWRQVR